MTNAEKFIEVFGDENEIPQRQYATKDWWEQEYIESKTGHCKDCKYFEYDSVARVDGIPLIVAHEICERWGDGCKTKENGYCFMFEPQERSDKE